jgi:hypothetical protein
VFFLNLILLPHPGKEIKRWKESSTPSILKQGRKPAGEDAIHQYEDLPEILDLDLKKTVEKVARKLG